MIVGALIGFSVWFGLYATAQLLVVGLSKGKGKVYPTTNAIPMVAGFTAAGALGGHFL